MYQLTISKIFRYGGGALAVAILFSSVGASAAWQGPTEQILVRVYTKSSDSHVGTLVRETEREIVILDLKTGIEASFEKTDKLKITQPLSLDDAARFAGLSVVASWRINQMSAQDAATGKIARITSQVVYIGLGKDSGIQVGHILSAYRNNGDIIDPDTGEVLGSERSRIASLEVIEVQNKFLKAKIKGDLEVELKVGDEVESAKHGLTVAVCPLLNEDGSLTNVGVGLAEDMTNMLVQRKVRVVERSVLNTVFKELVAQNSILFDQRSAQKLGKLAGANVVLTGKIVPKRNSGRAYVRLIDVESGEILFAVSTSISLSSAKAVPNSGLESRSNNTGRRNKATRFSKLGVGRLLPSFLETRARIERVSGDIRGVRVMKFDPRIDSSQQFIGTRDSDFFVNDFTFTIKFVFDYSDEVAYFGLGPGKIDRNNLYMKFHPPGEQSWSGEVHVNGAKIGTVNHEGAHTVSIIKEGKSVTFHVDPMSDGPSDDDFEVTIPNIGRTVNGFNSKNVHLFFGGGGIFTEASLVKGEAIYPASRPEKIVTEPRRNAIPMANSQTGSPSSPLPAPAAGESRSSEPRGAPGDPDTMAEPVLPFDLNQPLEAGNVEVLWAIWGLPFNKGTRTVNGSTSIDVTREIKMKLKETGLILCADTQLKSMVGGDPLPGEQKWLLVALKINDRKIRIGLDRSSGVCVTIPVNRLSPYASRQTWSQSETQRAHQMLGDSPFDGEGIVWARWGKDGKNSAWVEAYAPLARQIKDTMTVYNKASNLGPRKPKKSGHYSLRTLVSIEGQAIAAHLSGSSFIEFQPSDAVLELPRLTLKVK